MHYLDPNRPRLHAGGGLPLLSGPSARIVLPALYIAPRGGPEDNMIEIAAFFPMASGGASRHAITIAPDAFLAFWEEWLADPESAALKHFGWAYQAPAPKGQAPKGAPLDIDDILGALE